MSEGSAKRQKSELSALRLDEPRYLKLLTKLVGVAETLQNNPSQGLYPREDNASDHVLAALEPYSGPDGPLTVERIAFTEGRGNVIITYPGKGEGTLAFVGSHLDVVPANPEMWKRDPFALTIEGDELHGRGTTDCLGHVALITELMLQLAISRPTLSRTVTAILIVSEENGEVANIGIDQLMSTGKMDHLKGGPVIWVDCADSQPCVGTAGSFTWHLKATGKLFHSGLPHKGINSLEMANAACARMQDRFYEEFPAVPQEKEWAFITPSTMKPTRVKCPPGGLNQLPPWVEISGDVRLTPFYEADELKAKVGKIVEEMNNDLSLLETRGPCSRYEIEGARGELELTWGNESSMEGIACHLKSEGNAALVAATREVLGEAKPYSICGSLPLVRNLQRGGFDVQMTGFGLMSTYHADNEYAKLSDMANGFRILLGVVAQLEK